jgi:Cof subfamily protein (haloacid dehalogenase superfamily)
MDLDGTVLDSSFVVSPRTTRAIAAADDAGIRCVIATGRMFQSARRIAAELGVRSPLICYQGALVGDPLSGEILLHHPLEVGLARELLHALGPLADVTNAYVDDELYVPAATPEAIRYADIAGVEMHVVGPLAGWLERPTTKLVAVGEPAALDAKREELLPRFGRRAFIAKSLPFFLELAAPGVSKGSGLTFLSQRLGFTPAATVAFGDAENDLELLEWAGTGFAMANGDERLRRRADWIAPPVGEDGVARCLEALVAAR